MLIYFQQYYISWKRDLTVKSCESLKLDYIYHTFKITMVEILFYLEIYFGKKRKKK